MSNTSQSIIQQSIPSTAYELRKFIPRENYIKNSSTINRMLVTINSGTGGIEGANQSYAAHTFKFSYDRTQSAIVSLNEAFFHISGHLVFENISGGDITVDSTQLSFAPQWLLSIIQKLELNLGGTNYKTKNTPINYSHIKTLLSQDFNDLKSHVKDSELLQSFSDLIAATAGTYALKTGLNISTVATGNITVNAGDNKIDAGTDIDLTTNAATADAITATGFSYIQTYCEPDYSLVIPQFNCVIKTTKKLYVPFACKLFLRDLFELPEIPIYDLPIEVAINFQSKDAQVAVNCVGCASYANDTDNTAALTENVRVKVSDFEQFNFNIVSMQLDGAMRKLIADIYSKKRMIVVNDLIVELKELNGGPNKKSYNTEIPYEIGFESEFIGIAFPKTVANEVSGFHRPKPKTFAGYNTYPWDVTKSRITQSKMLNNTDPYAFQYVPIDSIDVVIDGISVWSRNFTQYKQTFSKIAAADITSGGYQPSVMWETITTSNPTGSEVGYFDHQYEYNMMKSCRFFMNQLDSNACTYQDFITKYYCILIPTKHFTQISSSSKIYLKIMFTNVSGTLEYGNIGNNSVIDNILFFNYNRHALVIENGIASVKDVRQSFSNQYDIGTGQPTTQMQTN